MLARKIFRKS